MNLFRVKKCHLFSFHLVKNKLELNPKYFPLDHTDVTFTSLS